MLGPNGSGKTTLLSVASMNLWPTRGTVTVLGERYGRTDARELRRRVGFAGSAILVTVLWRQFENIVHAGDHVQHRVIAGADSCT